MENSIPPKRPVPPRPPIKKEQMQTSQIPQNSLADKEAERIEGKENNLQVPQNVENDRNENKSNDAEVAKQQVAKEKNSVKPIIKVIDPVKRDKNRKIWLSILTSLCLVGAIVCFVMLLI